MAGCYGSHPEDRYFEGQLDRYLEESYPREFSAQDELYTAQEAEEAEADYNEHYSDKGE